MPKIFKHTKALSRKEFLKWIGLIFLLPFAAIWYSIVERSHQGSIRRSFTLSFDMPAGVSFFPDAIVNKDQQGMHIFSNRCTHLGCRISKVEEGVLVCPCHGSRFEINTGKPLNGPATRGLRRLTYVTDQENNSIVVQL